MKFLGKYWKALFALILIGAAVFLYMDKYKKEELAHQLQVVQTEAMAQALQSAIDRNKSYAEVQEQIEPALIEMSQSRQKLYSHFPVQMKYEDQIMYALYLETIFDTEIFFEFSNPVTVYSLADGNALQGHLMTVNYETTYEGFQEMINYLATDDRITSIQVATIEYDAKNDIVRGTLTLALYLVTGNDLLNNYVAPDVAVPELGKENIFE